MTGPTRLLVAGLLAALLPLAAQAGRAQVGIGMSTWSTTDLDGATASAQSWRDGLPDQQVTDAAAPPDKDWATVNLRVDSGARNTAARAEAQAQARLRSNGAAFSGQGAVASDVVAGTLSLQWQSSLAQQPGTAREGFIRGYPFAELWETFEVVYPIARLAPIEVTLSLALSGQLTGTDPADPLRPGVEAFLWLGGVATGDSHDALDPVWRSEAGTAGTVLQATGALQSTGCSAARGLCSGFVSLYAGLDLRGRLDGAPADAWQTARAPLDLAFDGQLALRVSDGVTLVRGDVSDMLPPVAWAQVSSVPEPATALAMLAGLAVLGGRRLRRRRALLGAALVLGGAWPVAATAQTWQLTANLLANAVQFSPGPGITVTNHDDLDLLNQPAATQLQVRSEWSETPVGGRADARFTGRVGLLKAYAAASNPYCCDLQGHLVTNGYSNATVQGRFYDTVLVQGAGLAPGTPVRYQVVFDISGTLSRPLFEMGGFLSVNGLAEVRLRDLTSFQEVAMNWDASRQAAGRYLLTLDTQVGHSLGLSGMLYAGADVSSYARSGRSAEADLFHSAAYSLAPSVVGLNTVGASGHDFLAAPVPEPATWASLLLGLAALGGVARVRRSGLRAC